MLEWWQGYKVHDTRTTVHVCNALCEVWNSRLHLDNDNQCQCHFIAWHEMCFGGNAALRLQKKNQKCPLKVTWAKVSLGQRHCGACKWQAWKQKQSKFAPRGRPGCPKCPSSLFVDRLAGQSHLAIPFSKKNLLHLYPLPERCNAGQASTLVWVFIGKRKNSSAWEAVNMGTAFWAHTNKAAALCGRLIHQWLEAKIWLFEGPR